MSKEISKEELRAEVERRALRAEVERRVDRARRKRVIEVTRTIRMILLFVVWGYLFIYNNNVIESDVICIGLLVLLIIYIVSIAVILFVKSK